VEYSANVLVQLNPAFGIVEVVKYTTAQAADAGFYAGLVDRAIALGADAIVGCDFKVRGATPRQGVLCEMGCLSGLGA